VATLAIMRVAVVSTHPIQNQVPWIRGLASIPGWSVRAIFGVIPDAAAQGTGFGIPFTWDVDLLSGYELSIVRNRARHPDTSRFFGLDGPEIDAALGAFAPDAVIVCGWHSRFLWQAVRACRHLCIPVLIRGDSNALRRRPAWKRWFHRAQLRRFAGFLAMGSSNAAFYRESGVPASRIESAPHCIDPGPILSRLPEDPDGRRAARARFQVPPDSTCFAFVGKLQPSKRPFDLLASFIRVAKTRRDLHLLFVGTGELDQALREAAAESGASVSFAGFVNQSEIGAAYGAADALVLPSDFHETWGLVVNEAMTCGLPAIVSDRVGCGPDLVRDGETGFVFRFGDVAALAGAIDRLAADPVARRTMGARARALVRTEYSVEKAVAGTVRGVAATLRRGRGTSC
jgi:glycosyltransferase involved in cell wall biosynthesis